MTGLLNITSLIPDFHYPITKSYEYATRRQRITDDFGLIASAIVGIIVLVGIPVWKIISNRSAKILEIWSKLNLGKWLLLHNNTVFRRCSTWIFFHSTTLFQLCFWLIILCPLSLIDINNGDMIFLAKRLGKLPAVCLPTILFLTIRPSPLPNILYLSLLPIHKWISRIVILQTITHVGLYLGYFQKKHTWFKMWKLENLYGWMAFAGFMVIIITSIGSFRNRWYKFFYINHYIWSWIIVVALQFHARPSKITAYTVANISILVGQIIYRVWLTHVTVYKTDVQVIDISPNLSIIEFPNDVLRKPAINPGAHIRMARYEQNILHRIFNQLVPNYHPYTLVSLPSDRFQKLIIRKGNFKLTNDTKYLITGSYDPHLLFIEQKHNPDPKSTVPRPFSIANLKVDINRALIVVGGSAVSFAIPIIRVMNYHGIPVKVVWVVRDFKDIVVLNYFSDFIQGDDFEIFITGNYDHNELLGDIDGIEGEGVEIAIDDSEESDDECCEIIQPEASSSDDLERGRTETTPLLAFDSQSTKSSKSRKSSRSRKSSISSNPFEIPPETSKFYSNVYRRTVLKLNLVNKIYKGRPTLNHRYHQWCTNESNFTQCSGPIELEDNTFVCCRNVPVDKYGNDLPRDESDAFATPNGDIGGKRENNCWVVSAGPKDLVRNTGLWARENGLKFHEESFFV